MRRIAIVTAVSVVFLAGVSAGEELPPIANGSLKLGTADFTIVDGIAFSDGDVTRIALSSIPLDRKAMKQDGRLDTFDVLRQRGNSLTIELGAEGAGTCLGLNVLDGDTMNEDGVCKDEFATALGVQKLDDGRIAGASTWKGEGGEHVTFLFNLPLEN